VSSEVAAAKEVREVLPEKPKEGERAFKQSGSQEAFILRKRTPSFMNLGRKPTLLSYNPSYDQLVRFKILSSLER